MMFNNLKFQKMTLEKIDFTLLKYDHLLQFCLKSWKSDMWPPKITKQIMTY